MISTGTIIDEKYEIVYRLGGGGFGEVYAAVQTQLNRKVAIKMLNTAVLAETDGLPRFEREAKAINALKHKNIVSFYGYGIWQQAPYMVMELVAGDSLEKIVSSSGPVDPIRALQLIRQVCEALDCAHRSGVIHRDLKPANIIVGADLPVRPRDNPTDPAETENIKLIDFGLAKLMPGYGVPGQKLTETGYALGTCHYMPPEQAIGGTIDARADLYSVGCILYYILAGRLPFDGDNNVAVMFQHLNSVPEPISNFLPAHAPVVPISALIENCLAKDPKDRYASATAVIEDIDAILSGNYTRVTPPAVPQTKAAFSLASSSDKTLIRNALVGAVVLCVLALFLLAFALTKRQSEQKEMSELQIKLDEGEKLSHRAPPFTAEEYKSMVLAFETKDYFIRLPMERQLMLAEHIFASPWRDFTFDTEHFGDADKQTMARAASFLLDHPEEFPRHWTEPYKLWLTEHAASFMQGELIAQGAFPTNSHSELVALKNAVGVWVELKNSRNMPYADSQSAKYFDLLCQAHFGRPNDREVKTTDLVQTVAIPNDDPRMERLYKSVLYEGNEELTAKGMAALFLGNLYLMRNDKTGTIKVARDLARDDISNELMAMVSFVDGNYQDARTRLKRVSEVIGKAWGKKAHIYPLQLWLARVAIKEGQYADALRILDAAHKDYYDAMHDAGVDPEGGDTCEFLLRALALDKMGRSEEAHAISDRITARQIKKRIRDFGLTVDLKETKYLLSPSVVHKLSLQ